MDFNSRKFWFEPQDQQLAPDAITPGVEMDIRDAPAISDEICRKAVQLSQHSDELLEQLGKPQAIEHGQALALKAAALSRLSLDVFKAYFGDIPMPKDTK